MFAFLVAAASVAVVLSGCAAWTPAELSWDVLPAVPLACLTDENCSIEQGDSPLELSRESLLDPNSVAGDAVVDISARKARFFNQRELIDTISKSARRQALDAQNPKGNVEKQIKAEVGDLVLLPLRPPEYVEEAERYRKSENFLKCQMAFYALQIVQSERFETKNIKDTALIALYTRYVDACFGSASPDFLSRLVLFAASTPNPAWQSQGVFCLGFAVDSKHVITAKHCLADPATLDMIRKEQWHESRVKLSPPPNSFLLFADNLSSKVAYKISSLHRTLSDDYFDPKRISDDVAIVEIEERRQLSEFDISNMREWDRIITFTTFIPAEQLRNCYADSSKCELTHLVRADMAATCVTPIRVGDCLSHACQTRPGSSGGPIIAIRNGKPSFVGIHTGSLDKETNSICKLPRENYYRNYGIAAESSSVFRALFSKKQ